jgi:3-phenylpropionate/trans-cinnamate dioxygenase ferredoxin reductase subunit
MSSNASVVIVGAGLAGATAATALRAEGFDRDIVMVGAETELPYERPPLSKRYLTGHSPRHELFVHPASWYSDARIDIRLGVAATGIDRTRRHVLTDDGLVIPYGKSLLATGSAARRLTVPGADLDRVYYLRTLADSERIRLALANASHIAIVGGGWIGLEIAAAARSAGVHVTVIEAAELPLLRVLGVRAARLFADLHRRHGVQLICGAQIAEITGGSGAATGIRLADGTHVAADAVIIGVGIIPNTELAESAGLRVDNGVTVDEHLRSSDPDILAVGDVANAYHPLLRRHLRVEHWANALNQPAVAVQTILGRPAVYDRLPYFFTDQYDVSMEYTGHVDPGAYDRVVFRGHLETGDQPRGDFENDDLAAFWLRGDRVLAGMTTTSATPIDAIAELIRNGTRVTADDLRDSRIPLESLTNPATTVDR